MIAACTRDRRFNLASTRDTWVFTVVIIPSGVVLFLLGSQLMRAGLFADDDRGARLRRRLMAGGLGCGVPLNAATALAGRNGSWWTDTCFHRWSRSACSPR